MGHNLKNPARIFLNSVTQPTNPENSIAPSAKFDQERGNGNRNNVKHKKNIPYTGHFSIIKPLLFIYKLLAKECRYFFHCKNPVESGW